MSRPPRGAPRPRSNSASGAAIATDNPASKSQASGQPPPCANHIGIATPETAMPKPGPA